MRRENINIKIKSNDLNRLLEFQIINQLVFKTMTVN